MFSDSGFCIYGNIEIAIAYAVGLFRRLISNNIPIRIGLGCGNFIDRSCPSRETPWPFHCGIFLGSAINRAAKAAKAPVRGFGVFLDDSVAEDVIGRFGQDVVVRTYSGENALNYQLDWFRISVPDKYTREMGWFWGGEQTVESWRLLLSKTAKNAGKEEGIQAHYRETLSFLEMGHN
jgi:hypothetical protein